MIVKMTDNYEKELAYFLKEHNSDKEYYIAFIPDTSEEISLLKKDDFYLCIHNDKIIGCIGACISHEQKVARLLGPIIDKEYFYKYIDILYGRYLQSLPEEITEIRIAFYEDNALCRRWCEQNGFILYNAETTMILNRGSFIEKEIPSSVILKSYKSKYKKGLEAVHPKGTFFTLEELIDSVSAYHYLILAIMRDEVVGYVYYEQTHDRKKGEIALLHVREDKRGGGIGTALLSQAIKELMNGKAEQITISVRVTNHDAIKLYKKIGFEEKDTVYAYKTDKQPLIKNASKG